MRRWVLLAALAMFTTACASTDKACAQLSSGAYGSDWLVVQLDQSGRVFNCWKTERGCGRST